MVMVVVVVVVRVLELDVVVLRFVARERGRAGEGTRDRFRVWGGVWISLSLG